MVIGILLVLLMIILAIAIVVVIVGYGTQVFQRYQSMKSQKNEPSQIVNGGVNDKETLINNKTSKTPDK
ncbi:MAG: hypothetical protein PHE50_01250 [Dehalococcoidales bacterium]|nr:hypothetical protein [Dehalococcoidales bacterium]